MVGFLYIYIKVFLYFSSYFSSIGTYAPQFEDLLAKNYSPVLMCILLYRKNATSDDRLPNMLDSICCSWAAFKKIPPCCKQRRITFTAKLLLYSVSHCHTVYEKTLQQFKVVVVVTFVKLDVICSYRGRLDCPVCKVKNRIRLDKHLENVHCEIEVSVLYSLHFVVKLECILM